MTKTTNKTTIKIEREWTVTAKLTSGAWIRPEKRLAIYIRDNFTCNYCGKCLKSADRKTVTLDHIIPRSKGGNNKHTNLITACLSCNSGRGAKDVQDYATAGALERIDVQILLPLNVELAKSIISGEAHPVENLR